MNTIRIEPVIHHHFEVHPALFLHPGSFEAIPLRIIPFFKIYDLDYQKRARETIEELAKTGMPHFCQKIWNELHLPEHIECNHYSTDLIKLECCTFNKQRFFTRAYRLRENEFFKIEIILHSDALQRRGSYIYLPSAYESARRFFAHLERNISPLHPLGLHLPEYFFYEELQKEVSAWEADLKWLKDDKNTKTKDALKEELISEIQNFQKNAKEKAQERRSTLNKTMGLCADFTTSHEPVSQCN